MTAPDRFAAEHWFLARGLPMLAAAALLHQVWGRSAPALAAFAVIAVNSIVVVAAHRRAHRGHRRAADFAERLVLALLVLVLPAAALAGWLVSRIGPWLRTADRRRRVGGCDRAGGVLRRSELGGGRNLVMVRRRRRCHPGDDRDRHRLDPGCSACDTVTNLALIGGMFVRALPVVLLTFLVFFNTYVWQMAAILSRARLWLALGFLFLIAAAFLVSSTLDRVRPILAESSPKLEGNETTRRHTVRGVAGPTPAPSH